MQDDKVRCCATASAGSYFRVVSTTGLVLTMLLGCAVSPRADVPDPTEPADLPFQDDFETGLDAWEVAPSSKGGLQRDDGDAASGDWAVRAHADADGLLNVATSTLTRTFRAALDPQLSFWYRVDGSDLAELEVDLFDGVWHNRIWYGEADTWSEAALDLSSFNTAGGPFQLRFRLHAVRWQLPGLPSSGYDVWLDNVRLVESGSVPDPPHTPTPATGATGVPLTTALQWHAGLLTTSMAVYGSTDFARVEALSPDALWISPNATSPGWPPMLEGAQTYYWRVVASNVLGDTPGPIWHFTTANATVFALPHVQTFGSGIPAGYETLVNTWSAIRADASRNTSLEGPADGCIVMEGGGYDVTYHIPGDPANVWPWAEEGGDNWRNTARFTVYLNSPGGDVTLRFDYRILHANAHDQHLRLDLHKGLGWEQIGDHYQRDSENQNWTRVALDLGHIPPGRFAVRFWSSVKYTEAHSGQGILIDQLVVQSQSVAPDPPFGPTPEDGATAVRVNSGLSWQNGQRTDEVDVYFSTDTAAVEALDPAARVVQGQLTTSYQPPADLPYATSYAWRVLARTGEETTAGPVWSFTTQPEALKALPYCTGFDLDPWADGWSVQGSHGHLWAWDWDDSDQVLAFPYGDGPGIARLVSPPLQTGGLAALDLSFEHFMLYYGGDPFYLHIQTSPDGVQWTDEHMVEVTGEIGPETFAIQLTENLGETTFVALTLSGNLFSIDGWKVDDFCFTPSGPTQPPQAPWGPSPPDQALTALGTSVLTWQNGLRTTAVDLYFGTQEAAVAALDPSVRRVQQQLVDAFDPAGLAPGTRYYWRVVAHGADEQTAAGPMWWFRTRSDPLKALSFATRFRADPWHEAWTQQNEGCDEIWGHVVDLPPRAGGEAPEMVCFPDGSVDAVSRLVSPPIDTTGVDALCVRFVSALHWMAVPEGLEMAVQVSADAVVWTDVAVWAPGDASPSPLCIRGIESDITYVSWTLRGDFSEVLSWAVDDVLVWPLLAVGLTVEDGVVALDWPSIPGSASYRVWATTDPRDGWTDLAEQLETTWTGPQAEGSQLFRVEARLNLDDVE